MCHKHEFIAAIAATISVSHFTSCAKYSSLLLLQLFPYLTSHHVPSIHRCYCCNYFRISLHIMCQVFIAAIDATISVSHFTSCAKYSSLLLLQLFPYITSCISLHIMCQVFFAHHILEIATTCGKSLLSRRILVKEFTINRVFSID